MKVRWRDRAVYWMARAAIGTAVGAGAGTGVVLATDGKEIRLAEGRKLKVSLTNPLTIRTK